MNRPMTVVLALLLLVSGSGSAQANPCAQFITCPDVTTSYAMRYPRQPMQWGVDYIASGAHVIFTHDDARTMFQDALAMFAALDPAVPADQSALVSDPLSYNNRVLWVPQQSLGSDPSHGDYALASCSWGFSSTPRCYVVVTEIRIAVDPTDGTHTGCWRNGWGQYCDPNACGDNQYDFPTMIRHEVGHAFGLTDNSSGLLMNPVQNSCSIQRYLATCEADTVRRRYHDNPAAVVEGFVVNRTPEGSQVSWSVVAGSRSGSFLIGHAPGLSGPWEKIRTVDYTGPGQYLISLPGVGDGALSLSEEETDGSTIFHTRDVIGPPPDVTADPPYTLASLDSVRAALMEAQSEALSPLTLSGNNLIFHPDSFATAARWLAMFKREVLGINSVAISVDSIGGDVMIRPVVQQLQPSGGTVTLLGSRSETKSITGQNLYTDPTPYYVNGRVFPGFPSEPQRNIIRSNYVVDTSAVEVSLTHLQPWYATDAYFVDFIDEDTVADPFPEGDGIPDVGRGIGRLPASNRSEADALVTWVAAHSWPNSQGAIWSLIYGQDVGWPPRNGEVARSMADSLEAVGIPNYVWMPRVEDSPQFPKTAAQRDAAYAQALNTGGLLLNKAGSLSGGYSEIDFGSEYRGFNYASLQPEAGKAPLELAWSCFTLNDAATRNPSTSPPLGDRPAVQLLMLGMIRAKIGATAGTMQRTNLDLQQAWYDEWLAHPSQGISLTLAEAQRRAVRQDPRNALIVPEYGLLGDADIIVPYPSPPVVSVDHRSVSVGLTIRPNPAFSEVAVAWALPQPTHVQLAVYDVSGRKVETLLNRELAAGAHVVSWNVSRSVAAGIYFVYLQAGAASAKTSVVVVR